MARSNKTSHPEDRKGGPKLDKTSKGNVQKGRNTDIERPGREMQPIAGRTKGTKRGR